MYTSGVWIAKKGHEEEFGRRWHEAVDRLVLEYPDITFRLLRDVDDPRKFLSIGGAWKNARQIEVARSEASYVEAMARLEEALESGDVTTYELIAEIS